MHNSCIDHFFVTSEVYARITRNCVIDDPTNLSSHRIVLLEFNYRVETVHCSNAITHATDLWHKATSGNLSRYSAVLNIEISNICVPHDTILCDDIHYRNEQHVNYIDVLCN